MKLLQQFGWILFYSVLGELLSYLMPFAVPGSVIGMILLFLSLHFGLLKMEKVEAVGTWLTQNMAILFVPAAVGLMIHFELIASIWWQIAIISLVSTSAVMIIVGKTIEISKKRRHPSSPKETEEA
ncbi:CidA/LrgA family protein [Marinilactibacillus sp. XAAS-LB27]|uniref:CidA/LrgA family protein n=1 Tax=Marinilactibacillus sp. XAAS-LB27 TaxID=3114538 RepID=UPI002E190FD4|nr:CidA/LrgA family protein [Marinilactibacillus sp. XAAS-LB27]